MNGVLILVAIQGAMGAFDTLYHHEFTEHLTWRRDAVAELRIHGVRNLLYAPLFLGLAWAEWHGAWVAALALLAAAEVALTLCDFLVEDKTRDLPGSERVTHTLLAINYGAILAAIAPVALYWAGRPTGVIAIHHGVLSWLMTGFGVGVALWGVRDLDRTRCLARRAVPPLPATAAILPPRLSILITGGTGFIGSRLADTLTEAGHRVTILSREPARRRRFRGPVTMIGSLATLGRDTPFDAIVNLAGEPIASRRWTARRRAALLASRIETTRAVTKLIAKSRRKPAVLVSGSAIGFYGVDPDRSFVEDAEAGAGFAAELCAAWEAEARVAEAQGVRVCRLRTGVVLGEGGMLGQMLPLYEFGLGGPIGAGRQWMSWIHIDDLVGLIIHAIAVETVNGPLNGTAPEPVRNRDFAAALGGALHRPALLPLPGFALRLALGSLADELLLGGQHVLPEKALATGYQFLYPTIGDALREIVA